MPSAKTIGKAVTESQLAAFEEACRKAGLTTIEGKEAMLKLFCETHGVEWPDGFTHGGDRKTMKSIARQIAERHAEIVWNGETQGTVRRLADDIIGAVNSALPDTPNPKKAFQAGLLVSAVVGIMDKSRAWSPSTRQELRMHIEDYIASAFGPRQQLPSEEKKWGYKYMQGDDWAKKTFGIEDSDNEEH